MSSLPTMSQRPAAKMHRLNNTVNLNRLSWDDLRIFVVCEEETSFRKASQKLNISSSTISRRIDRLEEALGIRLFNRLLDGISLTEEGQAILSSAKAMENSIYDVLRQRTMVEHFAEGSVHISITEGLGSYWLMPKLVDFQREHPRLVMSVTCSMNNADVLRMEADMAIQFHKPEAPDLIAVKLGRLHIYPFAADAYTSIFGAPKSIEDIAHHRLVDQFAPTVVDGAWARLLGLKDLQGIVGIRTNSSSALLYAVEKGAGIGGLPSYAMALGATVQPIDMGVKNHLDIWLTYHPDVRKTSRNIIVIDWLKKIFSPATYPWFQDEFIHPRDLLSLKPDSCDINSVEGFLAAKPFQ